MKTHRASILQIFLIITENLAASVYLVRATAAAQLDTRDAGCNGTNVCNHTGTQLQAVAETEAMVRNADLAACAVLFAAWVFWHGWLTLRVYRSLRRGSEQFGVPWKQLPKDIPQRACKNEAMQAKYKIL